jgi:hypothetical protein
MHVEGRAGGWWETEPLNQSRITPGVHVRMDRPTVAAFNDHTEVVPGLAEQQAALGLVAS